MKGRYIKYPHPDRDYYSISPYSEWGKKGLMLYHNQVEHATSMVIKDSIVLIGAIFGAVVGAKLGGAYGAVIGTVVAVAFRMFS